MKKIPVHLLNDRTDTGVQIKRFTDADDTLQDESLAVAHRDDHYIFFILESGFGSILIDFNEINIPASSMFYVLPSQVHQRIKNERATGWYIAIDTSLIPQECRAVFEGRLFLQQPHLLSKTSLGQCQSLLTLIAEKYEEQQNGNFGRMALHALLKSFLAIAASCYDYDGRPNIKISRPNQITAQFRSILTAEMRSIKNPSHFAARLNVSESYLSEALKIATGFSATYWIQQEVIMEAKRLLYYSELNVKQIAHELGYSDHSYFSRLFKKVTGQSAIAFRQLYRK